MAASLIGLGLGFLLGLRFKVFVLVPVTLAAAMLLTTAGLSVGWMLLTAIAIQGGYLLGVVARELGAKFSYLDWRWILRWPHNTGTYERDVVGRSDHITRLRCFIRAMLPEL